MTGHPASGRTKAQRAAFEQFAIDQQPAVSQRTIDALLAHCLIVRSGSRYIGQVGGHPIMVPVYQVPFDAHAQWCQRCAENTRDAVDGTGGRNGRI